MLRLAGVNAAAKACRATASREARRNLQDHGSTCTPGDDPYGMYDARNVAEDGQQDIQPEVPAEPDSEKDADWRK
jgi:hypothetical protein